MPWTEQDQREHDQLRADNQTLGMLVTIVAVLLALGAIYGCVMAVLHG